MRIRLSDLLKILTKTCLILFFISLCLPMIGQNHRYKSNNYVKEDSSVYDISELYLKGDRYPQIYKVGLIGCLGPENFKSCLSFALDRNIKIVHFGSALSHLQLYREGFSRKYKSKFEILLGDDGKILSVIKIRHHLKSLPYEEVQSILESIEWLPALYNLKPVKSKFILTLVYHKDACKYEYQYDLDIELNNLLKYKMNHQICILLGKYDLFCDRDEEYAKQIIKQEEFDALDKKVERIKKLGKAEIERIKTRIELELKESSDIDCHLWAIKVQDEKNAFKNYLKTLL